MTESSTHREGFSRKLELSVVIPCLNEADTLATCLMKARETMDKHGIDGELVVADNGSTDGSQVIAEEKGARLVAVSRPGYGSALMEGISAARGKFILMADADESYDLRELFPFVEKLRKGADLVQGCRLPSGGGRVLPGAMPRLHRWVGNPLFTLIAQSWFDAPVHDVYCGMRAFSKTAYRSLNLQCTGMEFATEMIVKASLSGARIEEVPVTLHPDGRIAHRSHLKTFRDGWRTLRLLLLCSPRWLFLMPGAVLILLGVLGYGLALPGLTVRGVGFDAHTLLFASLAILCGYQAVLFAILTKTFGIAEGFLRPDRRITLFYQFVTLERGLALAVVSMGVGLGLLGAAVNQWRLVRFGALDYAHTMRFVVPGATLTALGLQTALWSFFASVLGIGRRRNR